MTLFTFYQQFCDGAIYSTDPIVVCIKGNKDDHAEIKHKKRGEGQPRVNVEHNRLNQYEYPKEGKYGKGVGGGVRMPKLVYFDIT